MNDTQTKRQTDNACQPLPAVQELIAQLAHRGIEIPQGVAAVTAFGATPQQSIELLALIASGKKRATATLKWSYDFEAQPLPHPGDFEIVVDHLHEPVCLIRIVSVSVTAFDQVDAGHAALEGEGDLSLAWWRAEHRDFFDPECSRMGRAATRDMPVVCTVFEVVKELR